MKEEITHEVVDLYLEHELHLVVEPKCSECYKNPPQVELNEDGFIELVKEDEDYWEQVENNKILEL